MVVVDGEGVPLGSHLGSASPNEVTLIEATRDWHKMSLPTPIWGDFRDFAQGTQDREEWSAVVNLQDGRSVHCRFLPQRAGATMVLFQVQARQHVLAPDFRHAG